MDSSIRSLLLVVLVSFSLLLVLSPSPGRAQALQPHDPIRITSNSAFTCPNGVTCVNGQPFGDGSSDHPFVIEDWEITADTAAGIHIGNTQSFFIIRNVFIHPPDFTPGSYGIRLIGVANGRVENARISNFAYGMWLSGSQNTLTAINAWNNTVGIDLETGTGNLVSDNQIHNNTQYGIQVSNSFSNTFTGNNASSNGNGVCERIVNPCDGEGFLILSSSNNVFENNTAYGNDYYGFRTSLSSNNNIYRYNNVSRNQFGMIFEHSSGNQAYQNTLTRNELAIGLEVGNTRHNVTLNRIINNGYGVYAVLSTRNLIYNNYMQNILANAYDSSNQNAWNITKTLATNILGGPFQGGNFYSDYTHNDPDGDGIGNTPYPIQGVSPPDTPNRDLLPLVQVQPTGPVHDVEVRSVTAQPASGRTGATISLTVTVFNEGTVSESFAVSVTYNGTIINRPPTNIVNLPALGSKTFLVAWDTNGLGPGKYQIRANASTVPEELYAGNNVSPVTPVSLTLNLSPTAEFSITPAGTVVGNAITLDGTSSSDPDGTISGFSWDFGDGATGTGSMTSHTYSAAETYTVTLTVRDNEGATSNMASQILVVSSNRPEAPTNLQITPTNGRPTLTWSPPTNTGGSPITTYRIYRGTSNTTLYRIANTTSTSYVDTTASSGQTYYYAVSAVNQAAEGAQTRALDVLVPGSGVANLPMTPQMWLGIAAVAVAVVAVGVFVIRRRGRTAS